MKFDSGAAAVEIGSTRSGWLPRERQGSSLASLEWSVVGSLVILIIIGFGLRFSNLDALGFAEDEMNKLDAIHAYERGDITVIVQRGRTYFENQSKLEFVRANLKKVHEVSINGLTAVEIFVNEGAYISPTLTVPHGLDREVLSKLELASVN